MELKQEYDSLWSCNKKLLSDIKESKRILESTSMLLRLEKKEHLASLQVACEFIKRINSYIIPLVSPRDAQKKAESITRAIEKNFVEMQNIKKEECDSLDTK